jgi:hypothetical protein
MGSLAMLVGCKPDLFTINTDGRFSWLARLIPVRNMRRRIRKDLRSKAVKAQLAQILEAVRWLEDEISTPYLLRTLEDMDFSASPWNHVEEVIFPGKP